ncbi:IS5 family transposase [Hyalangium gracile]|uniref:IS5 family transposase n=1 Tax=Hyalangium gracile TaxID=394092 RepID=UPI001CCF243D|nr:IS5 family transposase [Hyalangium gracile]
MPEELWEKIEPLLPPRPEHPLGCHNPRVPDRSAMEAILLVLRTGMQWQALKATGICHPSSAYRRFREWLAAGVFHAFWRLGLLAYDALVGIDWQWMSLDGAMTKAPLGGQKTGPNPTDRGKKGTKRSVLTDRRGVPVGVVVAGANVNDHKLLQATFDSVPVPRPKPEKGAVQHLCVDAAYDCNEVRRWGDKFRLRLHIRPRRPPAKVPKKSHRKKARRWVVERAHSWMNRFRRILIRWEKREDTFLAMLHLALGLITWFYALPAS